MATQSSSMTHYSTAFLKAIGEQCRDRLPPASSVQAMFMYELQRASEAESLFHAQMFHMAKQDEGSAAQELRVQALENRVSELQVRYAQNEVEERVSANKVRLQNMESKLKEWSGNVKHMKELDAKYGELQEQLALQREHIKARDDAMTRVSNELNALENKISSVNIKLASLNNKVTGVTTTVDELCTPDPSSASFTKQDADDIAENFTVLFESRDSTTRELGDQQADIDKLFDTYKTLTEMIKTNNANLTKVAETNVEDLIDLGSPHGRSNSNENEDINSSLARIRSFTPGQPWM